MLMRRHLAYHLGTFVDAPDPTLQCLGVFFHHFRHRFTSNGGMSDNRDQNLAARPEGQAHSRTQASVMRGIECEPALPQAILENLIEGVGRPAFDPGLVAAIL